MAYLFWAGPKPSKPFEKKRSALSTRLDDASVFRAISQAEKFRKSLRVSRFGSQLHNMPV